MAEKEPLSNALVMRCVNFHGHQLLKQLTSSYPESFETLNLEEVDYKVYKARYPERSKQPIPAKNEIINFITEKCPSLFVNQEVSSFPTDDDDYGVKDRAENLPPLEYFMKILSHLKRNMFFKAVTRGDVLYVRVSSYIHESLSVVKVQESLGTTVKDLFDANIMAHLRLEDSQADPAYADEHGRWLLKTRLCVEVLAVDASDDYLLVGTNGDAMHPHLKDKATLGRAPINNPIPLLRAMKERTIKSYSETLKNLQTFNNPRSIRHLARSFNIDIHSHSSLMNSLKYKFPDDEMYRSVRKAQISRWAHKSVADGVMFFKRGQHEGAFQCLNKALQIDSENVEAFVAKGALLANFGRLGKAVENFEEALKYDPNHSNAQKYICETLVEFGKQLEEEDKKEEAKKSFKKCLVINPNHEGAKEALRKMISKDGDSDVSQNTLQDLEDIEEEFKSRKRPETFSSSKSSPVAKKEAREAESKKGESMSEPDLLDPSKSRSSSLSPLSAKMQMQEGKWEPPTTINTTSSYITPDLSVPSPALGVAYNYPPLGWASQTMVTVPPVTAMYPHPTAYPVGPPGPVISTSTYNREDEEYKARVDQFLKEIKGKKSGEKRSRSKKKHSKGKESTSKKKHKDSHKKRSRSSSSRKESRSKSYSSTSSSSSNRSSSSSSSSSNSSSSSSSSSSSNSRSSSSSNSSSRSSSLSLESTKKKKHKKQEKQKKTTKEKKSGKPSKSKIPRVSGIEDDTIPGLESLNEKLTAYYKKIEESRRKPPPREKRSKEKESMSKEREKRSKEKESMSKERIFEISDTTPEMMKAYEQSFRFTSKTKPGVSSSLSKQGVHPVFQESDDDYLDIIPPPTKNEKRQTIEKSQETSSIKLEPDGNTISKPSVSRSRRHSRAESRERDDFRKFSRSISRKRSRSPHRPSTRVSPHHSPVGQVAERHWDVKEGARSPSSKKYRGRGGPHHRGRKFTSERSGSKDRDDYYHEQFTHNNPYHHTRSRYHSNRFRGRGRFGMWRGGVSSKIGKKNLYSKSRESPEQLNEQEWESVIQAIQKKIEKDIHFGDLDPSVLESYRASLLSKSGKPDSLCPESPKSGSSRPETSGRLESSRPETHSKRDSSNIPKAPSKGNSHSKTCVPSNHASDKVGRFSKWDDDEKGKNDDSKIGDSLTEMETFLQAGKKKKMEEMKERNKEFLKSNIN